MHLVEPKTLDRPRTYFKRGFTIVELLVVIAVIGILAAFIIVSYSGIQQRATAASLQADLDSASRQLKLYQIEHEDYPTSVNDCPVPSAGALCLVTSSNNAYQNYSVDNTSSPKTFYLEAIRDGATYYVTDTSTPQILLPRWKQVVAGSSFTCALRSDSAIYCVGANNNGQLGNNTTTNSIIPVRVANNGVLSGKTIVSISAGSSHVVALDSNGIAYAWGYNSNGQLGNNSTIDSSVPVAVNTTGVLSGKTITMIDAGADHTIAVDSNGKVYSWGYNYWGQLGDNSGTQRLVPVAVYTGGILNGKTIVSVSAGDQFTVVAASNGYVYSWGYNAVGQLGNPVVTRSVIPVQVTSTGVLSGKTIVSVSSGGLHTLALDINGKVYAWGHGDYGQLGNNIGGNSTAPVSVTTSGVLSGKVISKIYAGGYSSFAVDTDGVAYSWGYGTSGQLGNNAKTNTIVPVYVYSTGVLSGHKVKELAAGSGHTIALSQDYAIYGWGSNSQGILGNGLTTASSVPLSSTSFISI